MSVLNHDNEENGKRWIVFVYIKRNFGTVSWLQHATVKFSDGPDWTEGKQAVWNILMTGIWMRWIAAFPYGIRGRRFAERAVVSGKGREKRGLGVAFGLYIKKCMKILVVVH